MIPLLMGAPNQQNHNAMTGFVVSSPTRPSHTVYLERVRARGRHDSPERADPIRRGAQLEAHQPDWRLPLAQGCRARKSQVASP